MLNEESNMERREEKNRLKKAEGDLDSNSTPPQRARGHQSTDLKVDNETKKRRRMTDGLSHTRGGNKDVFARHQN